MNDLPKAELRIGVAQTTLTGEHESVEFQPTIIEVEIVIGRRSKFIDIGELVDAYIEKEHM